MNLGTSYCRLYVSAKYHILGNKVMEVDALDKYDQSSATCVNINGRHAIGRSKSLHAENAVQELRR